VDDPDVNGRIILKLILKKRGRRAWTRLITGTSEGAFVNMLMKLQFP
jgi:hypothetical protein